MRTTPVSPRQGAKPPLCGFCLCMRIHPKTNVYIDGFNLYYGAVKDTPYKWLDLAAFCGRLLPKHDVRHIRDFTA